jgi:4-diphosphocytidyl-2-C-methyl-D-erythritol kinase
MSETWIAEAYAKINLGLHVLKRLPTDYHEIETGFSFIDWSDRFTLQPSGQMQLHISDEEVPLDGSNLIAQAIQALNKYVGISGQYKIQVDKQIPIGGGLGGGSSDAAMILRMLNKIDDLGLDEQDLIDLSRDLGADVPLFLMGEPGIGRGIGQDIEPAEIQPSLWILTVYPGFECSTAEAYQYCQPRAERDFTVEKILTDIPYDEWQYMLENDLEPPVMQRHQQIGNIKDQMYELGATYASMSGSGSSVFGLFEQDFVATDAFHQFVELEYKASITPPDFSPDFGIYRKG